MVGSLERIYGRKYFLLPVLKYAAPIVVGLGIIFAINFVVDPLISGQGLPSFLGALAVKVVGFLLLYFLLVFTSYRRGLILLPGELTLREAS